jgi:hypothetical protein
MGWAETGRAQLIFGPKWDGPKRAGPNRAATVNTDDAACDVNADGAANVKGW